MPMTRAVNPSVTLKDGYVSRSTTTRSGSKPFVVCSISTKRYAAPTTGKTPPAQRPLPILGPTSSRDIPRASCGRQTRQAHQPGPIRSVSSVVPKAETRCSFTKPALPPDPGKTATLKRSTHKDRSLSKATVGSGLSKEDKKTQGYPIQVKWNEPPPRPSCVPRGRVSRSSVGATSKEDKIARGCPTQAKSSRLTTVNKPAQRPACVPRGRVPRASVGATLTSKGKQEVTVKAHISRPRNTVTNRQEPSANLFTPRTGARTMSARRSVKDSGRRSGAPLTLNGDLSLCGPVIYPDADWSPPPSPDLSSFPSQSWTIAVSVDVKQANTPTTVCGDETPASIRDVEKLNGAGMHDGSRRPSEPILTSPALSSSLTVVLTPPNPAACVAGVDNTLGISNVKLAATPTSVCDNEAPISIRDVGNTGLHDDLCEPPEVVPSSSSPTVVSTPPNLAVCIAGADHMLEIAGATKEPSVEISPTECAAKIISRPRDGTTSADALAKMMERPQVGSPTEASSAGSRARTTVLSAFEIARSLFARPQHASPSSPGTPALKTVGTDMSRVRKLFVPPLEDIKASQDATIQMEIEILRARKKVAGGGVVDPRLERLGSLSAMAIVKKHSPSTSDRV